jgi:hypothetical protein
MPNNPTPRGLVKCKACSAVGPPCDSCKGTGTTKQGAVCPSCKGTALEVHTTVIESCKG